MGNPGHLKGEFKGEKLQSPLPFTVTPTTKDRLTRENKRGVYLHGYSIHRRYTEKKVKQKSFKFKFNFFSN